MLISKRNSVEDEITPFLVRTGDSETNPVLSLIVPTYNEGQNVFELLNRIETLLISINFEIIIVDDNSPDGTSSIVENINRKYGNIKVYKRSGKLGLSSAILDGFDRATGNFLAVIDADLQHPPEVLLKMCSKISEGYDLVVASRYIDGGRIEGWELHRVLISKMATLLTHTLFPESRKVEDVMSGCFMIKRRVLIGTELNPIGFKILFEILAKCKIKKVAEIPYTFTNRRNGKSNLTPKEMRNFLVHFCRLFFKLNSSRHSLKHVLV